MAFGLILLILFFQIKVVANRMVANGAIKSNLRILMAMEIQTYYAVFILAKFGLLVTGNLLIHKQLEIELGLLNSQELVIQLILILTTHPIRFQLQVINFELQLNVIALSNCAIMRCRLTRRVTLKKASTRLAWTIACD